MPMNKPESSKCRARWRHRCMSIGFFLVEGSFLSSSVWPPSLFRASLRSRSRSCLAGFLISGLVGLITSFWMRHAPGFWWSLVRDPRNCGRYRAAVEAIERVLSLTLVLIAFFVIESVASIMFALDHKRELSGRWAGCWRAHHRLILAAIISQPADRSLGNRLLVGINMCSALGADRDGAACREINPRSAARRTERVREIITVT